MKYISSGYPEIDRLTGRGFPAGYCFMLCGSPGAGKTMFGLRFLAEGKEKDERVLYISYIEPIERLVERASRFRQYRILSGENFYEARIETPSYDPFEILNFLESPEKPYDRIVIDSLNKLFNFTKTDMGRRILLHRLMETLRGRGTTTIFIYEYIPKLDEKDSQGIGDELLYETDGVINLHINRAFDKLTRRIEIPKMRDCNLEYKMLEYEIIDKKGIIFSKKQII